MLPLSHSKPFIMINLHKLLTMRGKVDQRVQRLVQSRDDVRLAALIHKVKKAFRFFKAKGISRNEIVKRIQANFRFENCLSANNDAEAEQNQILLNTLEDENNPIRAVFAVQKLNEGWDVVYEQRKRPQYSYCYYTE